MVLCISIYMHKYVYHIQGALENSGGYFGGFRVLVCDLNNMELVDIPREVLDKETAKYVEFRLKLTEKPIDIQKLPLSVQHRIRVPLGRWLDYWVQKNFYGSTGESKNTNS